ncbi:oligosaccharide flippase family protein [Staphylococcus sp. GDY8P94P]|uniref:lipopolysaccharide biosynthesis protein n=1 Tax=Staphylococcus sp. GDY8P94P TaxID=2804144 RepID=UPI001AEC6E8E|nr:oligosaccharide flippase family protein [Staphylococcus sp. GDY8P94P]
MKIFFKNVATMMSGTLIGQLIIIITLPIISRIYTPLQFGEYSNIVAIIGILSVLTTLRYDTGIAVTKNKIDRNVLISFTFIINIIISIFILMVLLILNLFYELLSIKLIFYIFTTIFLIGNVQILTNIATSNGKFKKISLTKFTQSLSQVLLQLLGQIFYKQTFFLYLGYLIGKSNGVYILYKSNSLKIQNLKFSLKDFKKIMVKFKDYPMYGLPSSLLNSFSTNIIIILVLYFFGGYYAGIYGLISRIMSGPLQLISKSFNSVLFKYTKDNSTNKVKKIYIMTNIIIGSLFFIVIFIFCIIKINLFHIIFGQEWSYANKVFLPLLIMMGFQFTIIPFIELFTVYGKQRLRLLLDISRIILLLFIFISKFIYDFGFSTFINLYSISMCVFYLFMHISILKLLKSQ